MAKRPYADTRLAKFLAQRIAELRPKKTQADISAEAGFKSVNMISQIKSGANRMPLARVPALAEALGCDPGELLLLALDQNDGEEYRLIEQVLRSAITRNEAYWIDALRVASGGRDPELTTNPCPVCVRSSATGDQ
jgi:transcriptional regulator with XRE-family HTH domain